MGECRWADGLSFIVTDRANSQRPFSSPRLRHVHGVPRKAQRTINLRHAGVRQRVFLGKSTVHKRAAAEGRSSPSGHRRSATSNGVKKFIKSGATVSVTPLADAA
jgi:hypothetical protein